ncbi:MAG: hypothetical protein F6K04_23750, partial [Leptolyngbya sp. SIO4C5]|nr:hypothetical protein [Leptolyngbya sp. SIO4C5]
MQEEAERRRLHREEQYVESAQQNAIARKFEQGIYFLVGALELLLLLRFILRLSGANPANTFANVIYNLSEPFIAPFSTLFISPTFNGNLNIFDVNLLVAPGNAGTLPMTLKQILHTPPAQLSREQLEPLTKKELQALADLL